MLSDFDKTIEGELLELVKARRQNAFAKPLAKLFSVKTDLKSETVRIVCAANDIDPHGEDFLDAIDGFTTGTVSLSCYWNDFFPAPYARDEGFESRLPDLSPITHQFHDEKGVEVHHIVVMTSNMSEASTIVANISRTKEVLRARSFSIVAPAATNAELTRLLQIWVARCPDEMPPNVFLGIEVNHEATKAFDAVRRHSNDVPLLGDDDIPKFISNKMVLKSSRHLGL